MGLVEHRLEPKFTAVENRFSGIQSQMANESRSSISQS